MPKISLWNKRKNNDYKFIDKLSSEIFYIGGVSVYIHKYLGPHEQSVEGDLSQPNHGASGGTKETYIQDLLFMENRDRKYDPYIYELRGHYTVADNDFDLSQFGLMLSNDQLYVTFHLNTMIDMIGRKLMSGDVIELPNMRDDARLDKGADAINRFYEITDGNHSAEGYSQTWYRHLWRCTCRPLKDSPQFRDILGTGENEDDLKNLISSYNKDIAISDALLEQAKLDVPDRNFQTAHFYIIPGSDEIGENNQPSIWTGDGKPPNGAEPLGAGKDFPNNANIGDYWLRTDYEPNVLYKYLEHGWQRIEVDYRRTWNAAHRILESFINNDNEWTNERGETIKEQHDLKKAVKPLQPDL